MLWLCRSCFFFVFCLFVCLWLCWVPVSARGLSLVAASGGHSSSRCAGLSLSRPLLLRSTGSRRASSVVVAHGPSCSTACGIFPDQGSNPCPLHWQADSQPLRHQGSPCVEVFYFYKMPAKYLKVKCHHFCTHRKYREQDVKEIRQVVVPGKSSERNIGIHSIILSSFLQF